MSDVRLQRYGGRARLHTQSHPEAPTLLRRSTLSRKNGVKRTTRRARKTKEIPQRGLFFLRLSYFPIIRIVNDPGTACPIAGRPFGRAGAPGGGGVRSCDIVKRCPVFVSSVIVRAPFIVLSTCSTSKLTGLFSFTTVNVPFPPVLKASIVAGLNTAPSEFPANGSFARIFPSFALSTTIAACDCPAAGPPRCAAFGASPAAATGLLHAANSTPFFASSANPLHPPISTSE